MFYIETGYDAKEQKGVMCVLQNRKLFAVRELVQSIDPKAFITVSQINEVSGRGFYPWTGCTKKAARRQKINGRMGKKGVGILSLYVYNGK